jgi:Ni2+-binding GTPase involved in maturation of urease and hydrogenase
MAPRQLVPILLLTGFLGSGKTSLLARWLREEAFAGAMVIVNELGEVGLDDRLVETSSEAPLLLDNGCACCAAGEDLSATLERLFFDRLHRRMPPFSWVLIETTGVADPAPIMERLAQGVVGERYELRGLVATFDAHRGPWQVTSHPECRSQIDHADAIILTRTDTASAAAMAEARACLDCLRPDAPVLVSANADLPATALLGALEGRSPAACGHDHGHAHHTEGLTSAFAPLEGLDEAALRHGVDAVMAGSTGALLRLKGLVRLSSGEWVVVQATPGALEIAPAPPGLRAPERSGVTIIAHRRPAADIAEALMRGRP